MLVSVSVNLYLDNGLCLYKPLLGCWSLVGQTSVWMLVSVYVNLYLGYGLCLCKPSFACTLIDLINFQKLQQFYDVNK